MLASIHPQIVHFTIVFIIVGVAFRLISLLGRPQWVGPAAPPMTYSYGGKQYVVMAIGGGLDAQLIAFALK